MVVPNETFKGFYSKLKPSNAYIRGMLYCDRDGCVGYVRVSDVRLITARLADGLLRVGHHFCYFSIAAEVFLGFQKLKMREKVHRRRRWCRGGRSRKLDFSEQSEHSPYSYYLVWISFREGHLR